MNNPSVADSEEWHLQKELLLCRIGEPGSGFVRYAAAMYFYQKGLLSTELLEIYRRCCKYDAEDPIELAYHEEIAVPEVGIFETSISTTSGDNVRTTKIK